MSNNIKTVKSILIVGGGSAGWITANLLNSTLNSGTQPRVKIKLVEAPDIDVIGVGEATVPSIRRTLQIIGISEKEFMTRTDATFKSLIRFVDWNMGQEFDHPFDQRERPQTDPAVRDWLSHSQPGNYFAETFSILTNTSNRNLAPKVMGWPDYQSTFPYAYHLDAVKLGRVLRAFGTQRGIEHLFGKVVHIKKNEDGGIASIELESGKKLSADLYIDCSGFRAVLAKEIMPEERDYSDTLFCDSAITMNVPYDIHRPSRVTPYTAAIAKSSGWIWDINLQNRRGLGYVYSSGHQSYEDALAEFIGHEGPHASDIEAGYIKFKTYKRVSAWHQNCVAIGLADGFVEPLESTGLYMMQFAALRLADILDYRRAYEAHTTEHFNIVLRSLYDEIIGYVAMHYLTSQRRDTPFWRDATNENRVPDSLKHLFHEWQSRPPHDTDMIMTHRLFSLESYEYLLFGMGFVTGHRTKPQASSHSLRGTLEKCYAKLPPHETWFS